MKLTKTKLKILIKEELQNVLNEVERTVPNDEDETYYAIREALTSIAQQAEGLAVELTMAAAPAEVKQWAEDITANGNWLNFLAEKLEELQGPPSSPPESLPLPQVDAP